ncbi:MAG TPA: IPT/TIG domain-containing protein [Thermoanaerobaculia bacterium]|nr:IPT/TIG domain-containing protein [Thermoanaerobaculia bacterium]
MRLRARALLFTVGAIGAASCEAATHFVAPGSAWCGVVNAAAPGDTVLFAAGSYPQTCAVTASGTAGAPITLRSQSGAPADRAFFTYAGASSNIVDVYGSYLVFRWLTFGPTAAGVNPLKLRSSLQGVVVDQNFFDRTDIAVAANSSGSLYQDVSVTNNVLSNMLSTGLYFGCHDGVSCHALNILIRGNVIRTVQPGDGVGYGLEIKLNSWATILENTIYDPQGPGIDVYGSNRGDPPSVVERNYVEGSKTDAGINISGGPAIVRNNIVVGNRYNGIWAQNYGGRGLQQNVWIVHNTALGNQTGGIQVSSWVSGAGNVLAYNAIAPLSGTPALTPASPLADPVIGNRTCSPATSCFAQPATAPYDLWPVSGGVLIGAAGAGSEPWRPADDFMCVSRLPAADIGAMQRTAPGSGPLVGSGNARPPCSSAPTILSISPRSGRLAGDTLVTILGTNFQSGATVRFGLAAATSVSVSSSATLTAHSPSSASAGSVDVTVTNPDAQSATLPSSFTYSAGAHFYSVAPCRVVDTRGPTDPWGGPALAANTVRIFLLAGRCGIPPSAQSVAANVTITQPTAAGFLSIYAGGTTRPLVSTVNFAAGQTRANNAVLPIGSAGDVAVFCAVGTTQAVIDVTGYFE